MDLWVFPCGNNEWPFQDHLHSKTIIWPDKLSSGRPKQWMWRVFPSVTNKQPFQDHLPSKITVLTWWALSPRRWEQLMCGDFPCVTNKWPFQDHLSVKSVISDQWSCLSGDLNNEYAEKSLSSVTDEWPFQDHLLSKTVRSTWKGLCPRKLDQWMCRIFPGAYWEQLFQDHLQSKSTTATYHIASCEPVTNVPFKCHICQLVHVKY